MEAEHQWRASFEDLTAHSNGFEGAWTLEAPVTQPWEDQKMRPNRRNEMFQRGNWQCSRCHYEKPIDQFWKNRALPHGLENYCKKCRMVINRNRIKTAR